jgi:uncharacterized membrane protein YdfJ with MMPL/SSD domain
MNLPQAPNVSSQPPGNGPGCQGPEGPVSPRESRKGVASIACAALVVPSMVFTAVPTMFVALFTRPDTGSNGKEWMANMVFLSLPVLFGLLSVIFGLVALRRTPRGTNGWSLGVAGLIVVGVEAAVILLPAVLRGRFDVFY